MRGQMALSGAIAMMANAAQADLCRDIEAVDAQTNRVALTLPLTGKPTTCRQSLMLGGGAQLHCGWAFPYRSDAASQAFEHLVRTVATCLGDEARITADLDVNHPDYYDLQTFTLERREVGVSLKDKATLAQTFVFLRVTLSK